MKDLLTGDEAIARGAWEAGVRFASAYPGTPSTEILENIAEYRDDVLAEWAVNEKVAAEAVIGASIAGVRALCAMKHVGLNVAADPFVTFAYTGVNGGMVLVTADEPGMHSSQNEQDNRNYARLAHVPLFEPADSQECLDMIKDAFELSEQFDTPVLFRVTTRVCHSKSLVELGDRAKVPVKRYVKNPPKFATLPAHARVLRVAVEERTGRLGAYAETSRWNRVEENPDASIGVICSGACYYFAREVLGNSASYLKLGFTHPLPARLVADFAARYQTLYVIEENDPLIADFVRRAGFQPADIFPHYGELTPDVIRRAIGAEPLPRVDVPDGLTVGRPPALCAGCPHRGFFLKLGEREDVMVSGDIGCYGLATGEPFNAVDSSICMGASISLGHGAQQVFDLVGDGRRVVTVLGDSTFFHTGINSLLNSSYNGSRAINVILDNRITGMTGQQQNPGTGLTLQGKDVPQADIEALVRACGIKDVRVVDPNRTDAVSAALDWAMGLDRSSVIITRWPCTLKQLTETDRREFPDVFTSRYEVDFFECIGCEKCLDAGCPALSFDVDASVAKIDSACVGCGVCGQLCPVDVIVLKQPAKVK